VRLVGAARPPVWNGRLAGRCAIVGVPVGALTGILLGLLLLRQGPTDALWSYGIGAVAGGLIGLVLGSLLGAVTALVNAFRWSRPVARPRRLWVRHRQ
jgi:ABC-type enterobactin transport system permease subunit